MVGAADPFQLFRIMHEIVLADALDAGAGHRVHARPVPQHRGEDPGGHPVGDERAGGHGQGAAGRPRRAARPRSTAGDVLGANAVLMDAYNTDVRPLLRRAARGAWAWTPTRSRPTSAPATSSRSRAERVGGTAGRLGRLTDLTDDST